MADVLLNIQAKIKGLEEKLDKSNKEMRKLGGESKNAEKQVNKSFTNMQTKVRKFAMYFGAALGGAAVVGAIKKSIDAMKEFEQTFSNVLTLLSAAERKKFGGFLKEGSINLMRNYGFAVQDVNKALFDSISAGIKAGDSIKFMNEAAKLAKGGVTSLSIAVDGMTSIMNAYGLSAKDAEKVSAAFFTAQKYGKCFAKGTEILMFNGNIKKVEDIIVGDQLMGNDNKPRNVLALGKGREMMYEIIMRDGSMYTVNGSHILSLKERYGYNSSKKRITNITVNDYLKKSISFKRRTYGYKPQIPLSFKNQYDPKYSSYLLGLWIADGRKDNVTISVNNKDIEIMDFLYKQASENNCKISIRNIQKNSSDISLVYYKKSNPIKRYLKELDIYNNKHIPHKLKSMSIKNRLEFLAGYLDGDGYLLKGNTVCYSCSSSNKSIIDGIQFIAGSLGFSAKYKYRERFDKRTNKIYQEHSLIIGGDIERIPVKLKRKQINYKTRKYDWNIYSFKVKKVGVGDYYGFNIDGNRLFVLNHFNVTHNTTVEELASSIGRVAPIMKTAGISYQEGLSALALLTAQGISTEESVTALRATIQALIRPTTQSTKIFKELGIETGIVAIRNNGLGKTLLDVAKATKTDADKLAELIPNVRALTGIAALGEEALQKYDVILKEVNEDYGDGSSLAQAYTLQSSTLAESINRLKGAASAAKIKLGGMFAPIIKGFADLIAPMQETSELLIKERTELNLLIGAITNSSNTQESRLRLIEQLNVEYPDFLEGLDTEKVSNEELKTALEDVNAEYEKKIQLSVAQEIYALQSEKLAKLALEETNLIEKQNKVLDKNADKLIGLQTIGKGRIAIKAGLVLGMVNESNALAKNMIALDDNREAQAKLNKQAQISIERLNELRSLYGDDKSAGGGGVVTEETVIQTSKWLDEMFKKYGQYFAKVDASQDEWFMKLENDDILHEMAGVINKKYYDDLEVASEETKREQLKAIYDEMFKDIEATEEKKRLIKEATFDAAFNLTDAFSNMNKIAMNKELADAGDNEKKKEEIRKKYAEKGQTIAVIQAIISGAEGIVKTGANLGYPLAIPFQVIQAAQTAAQIALIKSQKFEKGGYEVLGGKRHADGGTPVAIGEAERDEGHAIFSRWATAKYGRILPDLVDAINKGKFPAVDMTVQQKMEAGDKLMRFTHTVSLDESKQLEEIKKLLAHDREQIMFETDREGNHYKIVQKKGYYKKMRIR